MLKMAWPCWMATTRRVVKDSPVADPVDLVEDRDGRVARAAGSRRAGSAPARARRCDRRPSAPGAATWPPKTRWRSSSGWVPRKMLTSIGSRSSRRTRKSRDSLTGPCWQAPHAAGRISAAPVRCAKWPRRHVPDAGAFPEGFLWGTATAAHQIEGGNVNNDWWAFEHEPGSGCVDAERGRLRLVAPLAPRTSTSSPIWARGVPVLARVEPHRAGRGRVLAWPPSTTTGGSAPPAGDAASCRSSRSTTSPPRGGWPTAAGASRPTSPERFARFVEPGRRPTSATSSAGPARSTSPTSSRCMGYTTRRLPARGATTSTGHEAVNEAMVRAHRLAVDALRAGPGRLPGRAHALDGRDGGRSRAARRFATPAQADPRGRLPAGHRRATTSSACSATPDCASAPRAWSAAGRGRRR